MSSASFRRMATVAFTTKRSPAMSASGRGEPAAHLTSDALRCLPLDPADSQQARDLAFRLRQETNAPIELLQTYVDADLDILEGDVLVVGGREYPVRNVGDWTWRGSSFLALLVEDIK